MILRNKYILFPICFLLFSLSGKTFCSPGIKWGNPQPASLCLNPVLNKQKSNKSTEKDSTVEMYVKTARFALEQDEPALARNAVEHYFQKAHERDSNRNEMATTLKWALLKTRRLNEDFLSFGRIPEMGLMLPFGFPAINIAKPYSCLTMACGLYVPALSTMICATDRNGLDLFSARLLTEICLNTGRISLARRYIAYLPANEQTDWFQKLQKGKQSLWAWDSLPYYLPAEPYGTDDWVQLYYPMNGNERAALGLSEEQSFCLLDYFALLQLLYKRLDLLPFVIDSYRDLGAKRLPTYIQEAYLLSVNYMIVNNSTREREKILQWRSGNLRIDENVIDRFEQWFSDFLLVQNGTLSLTDMQKKHGDSYAFYFIWDGITY